MNDQGKSIRTTCVRCGAVYETERKDVQFIEKFACDCGHDMAFTVPARPLVSLLKADTSMVLALNNPDMRLDTGMTVKEAIQRAAAWWDKTGAKEMKSQLKRQAKPVGGADHGAGASFIDADIESPNFLPSSLINGLPWADLESREQMMVVKAWHHFFIRNPDVIGDGLEVTHKMQDRNKIQ